MEKLRFSGSQVFGIIKQAKAGTSLRALCHERGIGAATFYKWRIRFGGTGASIVARLKEIEDENRRLKRVYAEVQLGADLLNEAQKTRLTKQIRRQGMSVGKYICSKALGREDQTLGALLAVVRDSTQAANTSVGAVLATRDRNAKVRAKHEAPVLSKTRDEFKTWPADRVARLQDRLHIGEDERFSTRGDCM